MKILCTSDLHGNLTGLSDFISNDIEMICIAGDFSKMTGFRKWHLYDQKKWIEKKFFNFTSEYPNIQFILTPGNHDLCLDPIKTNCYNDLNWNISWPDNVHCLIDKEIEINNFKIYGTPYVPIINYHWAFESESDVLTEKFKHIPENIDILITHSPPKIQNTLVDYSIQTQNGPFGSSELAYEIYLKKPKYVFCGHIHSGSHDLVEFEKSKIYNVSRLDEDYTIAYDPIVIDI